MRKLRITYGGRTAVMDETDVNAFEQLIGEPFTWRLWLSMRIRLWIAHQFVRYLVLVRRLKR